MELIAKQVGWTTELNLTWDSPTDWDGFYYAELSTRDTPAGLWTPIAQFYGIRGEEWYSTTQTFSTTVEYKIDAFSSEGVTPELDSDTTIFHMRKDAKSWGSTLSDKLFWSWVNRR